MATNNMHNIATLIKRLEAATSRLEDIATSVNSIDTAPISNDNPTTNTNGATRSVVQPSAPIPESKSIALPKEIEEFDAIINGHLAAFVKLSELDPLLLQQAKALKDCFDAERTILLLSTKAKKPTEGSQEYLEVYKDIQTKMIAVTDFREKNRQADYIKDNLALVSDGTQTLSWIIYDSKPAEQAAELFGGAQMYGNKLLRKYKESDPNQVEWVNTFYKLMKGVISYIKSNYHPQGLKWNSEGVSVTEALKEIKASASSIPDSTPPSVPTSAPASVPSSGPPPPPPPPPPGYFDAKIAENAAKPKSGGDMGAIFSQLNQGEAITSGLKKVDPSQQTHKNPSLRAAGTPSVARSNSQGSTKSIPPGTKPKPESMRTKKPPKKEFDSNKWIIENFDSPTSTIEIEAERNHSILISKCKNTTIRIVGKGNAISIDNSNKTSIIVDSLVSSVDVIKCPNFALQILESVPTVLLDQVDGATIYLSKDSLNTEVLTSKCSAVNIYLPPKTEEEDYEECPVPAQFRSFIKNGKLITEIVEHEG